MILAGEKLSGCSNFSISFGSDDINYFCNRNISEQIPFSLLCCQACNGLVTWQLPWHRWDSSIDFAGPCLGCVTSRCSDWVTPMAPVSLIAGQASALLISAEMCLGAAAKANGAPCPQERCECFFRGQRWGPAGQCACV